LPQDIIEKYDLNQDGKLDENERAELHKDIQDGKVLPPRIGRGPRHDRERPSPQAILQRFDADQDGRLDLTELTAFLNSMPPPMAPPHVLNAPEPPDAPAQQQ
jgi:Ca2+-binding EF-hand superfamily protein